MDPAAAGTSEAGRVQPAPRVWWAATGMLAATAVVLIVGLFVAQAPVIHGSGERV